MGNVTECCFRCKYPIGEEYRLIALPSKEDEGFFLCTECDEAIKGHGFLQEYDEQFN